MSKLEADNLLRISAASLRKWGYFQGWKSGSITWSNRWSLYENSIGIEVSITEKTVRIYYTETDSSGRKNDIDYKIHLTTTPCPYGGKRYWFICPLSKNGHYCGKKVGVLYKRGHYFACRNCHNLTYASRNLSRAGRGFASMADVERSLEEVKRTKYRGKWTRKFRRYLRLNEKFENALLNYLEKREKK